MTAQLPPVAFNQDVPAVAMHPVMGDPVLAMMGRTVPAPVNPDVAGAIPAVIAADPDKFRTRSRASGFNDGGGRSYADHDLCKRGSRQ